MCAGRWNTAGVAGVSICAAAATAAAFMPRMPADGGVPVGPQANSCCRAAPTRRSAAATQPVRCSAWPRRGSSTGRRIHSSGPSSASLVGGGAHSVCSNRWVPGPGRRSGRTWRVPARRPPLNEYCPGLAQILCANFKALIGIFSQSVGPSHAIWANPVQFSFQYLPSTPRVLSPANHGAGAEDHRVLRARVRETLPRKGPPRAR